MLLPDEEESFGRKERLYELYKMLKSAPNLQPLEPSQEEVLPNKKGIYSKKPGLSTGSEDMFVCKVSSDLF